MKEQGEGRGDGWRQKRKGQCCEWGRDKGREGGRDRGTELNIRKGTEKQRGKGQRK
jgi:hypothetical protein